MVLLRFDKSFGNNVAYSFRIDRRLRHSVDHVYDCARNFIGDFVGVDFRQIVGQRRRGFVGDRRFVYTCYRNFLAYPFGHFLVVGRVDRSQIERVAEFVGYYIRNRVIIEIVRDFFGYGSTAFVVDENLEIFGFKTAYFQRNAVREFVLVKIIINGGNRSSHTSDFVRDSLGKLFLVYIRYRRNGSDFRSESAYLSCYPVCKSFFVEVYVSRHGYRRHRVLFVD